MHPFVTLQYVLPQHALSRLLGAVADSRQRHLKRLLIKAFVAAYGVDLSEAIGESADDYSSFNDFFTRRLRPDARPIAEAPGQIVSPADGTVSQAGVIRNGSLLQAKGHEYAVADLLGNTDFAHVLHRRLIRNDLSGTVQLPPRTRALRRALGRHVGSAGPIVLCELRHGTPRTRTVRPQRAPSATP